MELKLSTTFKRSFEMQIAYIAQDKPRFAAKFRNDILKILKEASKKPQLYRKSKYIFRPNFRDVIYKGHTIIVKESKEFLEVIDIIYMQAFPDEEQ